MLQLTPEPRGVRGALAFKDPGITFDSPQNLSCLSVATGGWFQDAQELPESTDVQCIQ